MLATHFHQKLVYSEVGRLKRFKPVDSKAIACFCLAKQSGLINRQQNDGHAHRISIYGHHEKAISAKG